MKKQSTSKSAQKFREIDSQGYQRLNDELAHKKKELHNLYEERSNVRDTGDPSFLENPALSQLQNEIQSKCEEIEELKLEMDSLKVVEFKTEENIVGIGDIVTLEILYQGDDEPIVEEYTFVSSSPDTNQNEISENCPIGHFVIGKKIGAAGIVFLPTKEIAKVKIISKR